MKKIILFILLAVNAPLILAEDQQQVIQQLLQQIQQLQQNQNTQPNNSAVPLVEAGFINPLAINKPSTSSNASVTNKKLEASSMKTLAFKDGLRDPFSKTEAIYAFLQQDNLEFASNQPSESNVAMK